jgi:hypothetical protein
VARVAVMMPGLSMETAERLTTDAGGAVDGKFGRVCNAVGEGLQCVAYGRAGQHAGVDVFLEPTEPKGKGGPIRDEPADNGAPAN